MGIVQMLPYLKNLDSKIGIWGRLFFFSWNGGNRDSQMNWSYVISDFICLLLKCKKKLLLLLLFSLLFTSGNRAI